MMYMWTFHLSSCTIPELYLPVYIIGRWLMYTVPTQVSRVASIWLAPEQNGIELLETIRREARVDSPRSINGPVFEAPW